MESYSHPDIPVLLEQEGNSTCVDCGSEKPKWASMNNGVFLCLKCAGVHRGFGMSISLIRSLQIDSWTEKQLLYLTKGGNKNFKNNLSEFNIAETAVLDIKYKSKAADYYRKYLKNEVDRESDPNYVPTQIVKPEVEGAMEIIEVKEDENEEKTEKKDEKDKQIKKKFFGFMSNVLNKVKEGTTGAAKKVGKGITDLKIGDKLKVAGNAIAGAAKTSGHFIADKTTLAVNKTKEGMTNLAEKTKQTFRRGSHDANTNTNENTKKEEKKVEDKKEEEKKEEDKKEEEKKEEDKKEEEKKEEEKKEEKPEENKEEGKKDEEKKEEEKKEQNKEEEKKEEKKEEEKKEEKKEEPEDKGDAAQEPKKENPSSGQA